MINVILMWFLDFFSSPEKNVKFKHVKSTYFTCLFSVGGGLSIQEQNILPSPLYDSINIYNRHRHHHHRIHSVWAHVHSIINKKKVKMIEPENKWCNEIKMTLYPPWPFIVCDCHVFFIIITIIVIKFDFNRYHHH